MGGMLELDAIIFPAIQFQTVWYAVSDHDFHNITLDSPNTDYKEERMNE